MVLYRGIGVYSVIIIIYSKIYIIIMFKYIITIIYEVPTITVRERGTTIEIRRPLPRSTACTTW